MNNAYLNALAQHGASLVAYIGLIDDGGVELSGGDPAYARQAVTWTEAANGLIRPTANLVFNVPAGVVVAGWRGYSAPTGGIDYGGGALIEEAFVNQGQYTLIAALTGIDHLNNA